MATLWDQFTQAIAWLKSPTIAAVRAIARSEVNAASALLFEDAFGTVAPPTTDAQGVDIAGLPEVCLGYERVAPKGGATVVAVHGYNGDLWVDLGPRPLVGERGHVRVATTGLLRLAVSLRSDDLHATSLSVYLTPHNASSTT